MIKALLGNPVDLTLTLQGGETNKYVRARILDTDDISSILSTVDLVNNMFGVYSKNVLASVFYMKGNYPVIFTVYTDAGYSVVDPYYGYYEDNIFVENPEDYKLDDTDIINNDNTNTGTITTNDDENTDTITTNDDTNKDEIITNDDANKDEIVDTIKNEVDGGGY